MIDSLQQQYNMAIASRAIAGRDDQRLGQVLKDHVIFGQHGEVQQPGARGCPEEVQGEEPNRRSVHGTAPWR